MGLLISMWASRPTAQIKYPDAVTKRVPVLPPGLVAVTEIEVPGSA
jgi:hypothetical protein